MAFSRSLLVRTFPFLVDTRTHLIPFRFTEIVSSSFVTPPFLTLLPHSFLSPSRPRHVKASFPWPSFSPSSFSVQQPSLRPSAQHPSGFAKTTQWSWVLQGSWLHSWPSVGYVQLPSPVSVINRDHRSQSQRNTVHSKYLNMWITTLMPNLISPSTAQTVD